MRISDWSSDVCSSDLPSLLASAQVRILDRKLGVDSEIVRTALVNQLEKRGSVRWEDFIYAGPSLENVDTSPVPSARFGTVDSPLNDTKQIGRASCRARVFQ